MTTTRQIGPVSTPEAAWQAWLAAAAIPAAPLGDWLAPDTRLVVVSPHPDDEVLACGGLLTEHAQRGGDCLVIAVTDGEASHHNVVPWTAERLAQARRAERQEGLRRLGLGHAPVMSLHCPDGAVRHHVGALATTVAALLRRGDLVVTTWCQDGHPDHEACGEATVQACAARGCRLLQAPVWMWHWARPADPRVPWSRLCHAALPLTALARKQAALAAHVTQLTPRGRGHEGVHDAGLGPVLDPAMLARSSRPSEYFFV